MELSRSREKRKFLDQMLVEFGLLKKKSTFLDQNGLTDKKIRIKNKENLRRREQSHPR